MEEGYFLDQTPPIVFITAIKWNRLLLRAYEGRFLSTRVLVETVGSLIHAIAKKFTLNSDESEGNKS